MDIANLVRGWTIFWAQAHGNRAAMIAIAVGLISGLAIIWYAAWAARRKGDGDVP